MAIDRPGDEELDAVVALIADQQGRPERSIVYVGEAADGIRAELDALSPPWTDTVRVGREGGRIVAAALAEWDAEIRRAWLFGPWVAGDDDAWSRWARPVLDAVVASVPDDIADRELAGALANEPLAALAADLGWTPSVVNHAYVVDRATASGWPPASGVRAATAGDLARIEPLHDAEFPATYWTAAQLLERAETGEHVVLVAEDADGAFAGYAAGTIQPDGEGYIDFLAVDEHARGGGIGRRLVTALTTQLLASATLDRVALTVQDHRAPARALYASLGFRLDASFRGYRSTG